jgi:hypothetical protein
MAKRFKDIPNLPFAPIAAGILGAAIGWLVFRTPDSLFERLVEATGIASILPAAKPPLGSTARTLLSLLTALGVSGLLWAIMRPIEGIIHARRMAASRAKARGSFIPAADIQMDVQPEWVNRTGRSPIFAERELGAPFMSDEALSKGEELLLDSVPDFGAETGDETQGGDGFETPRPAEAIDLSDWQIDEEDGVGVLPVEPEVPVLETAFTEIRTEFDSPTVQANDDASLSQLMQRLEAALDRRTAHGKMESDAPLAGNIASLHELIGLQRKSVI